MKWISQRSSEPLLRVRILPSAHKKMSLSNNLIQKAPKEVSFVLETIGKAGFEAFLVGGCVRDLILGKEPKDWDLTTSAKPDEIIALFKETVYENSFGTVMVKVPKGMNLSNKEKIDYEIVEVTPYRIESNYTDYRHPDEVRFSQNLEDDLKRRDFTINALVADSKGQIKDFYKGQEDIKDKVLRTVGEPDDRFREDPLRMLRAVRFAVQLGFSVSHETSESIFKNNALIKNISNERIRDEFVKIVMSESGSLGIVMLNKFGLLRYIIPELEEGIGCEQSGGHKYDVWNHLLHALQHAIDKDWPLEIRLSALFHDIGKPRSRRVDKRPGKKMYTFYGHEVIGARMVKKIMGRLKFPMKQIEYVEKMVRNHMFFSDPDKITLSAVRRIVKKVSELQNVTHETQKAPQNHTLQSSRSVLEGQDLPNRNENSSGCSFVTHETQEKHPIWELMMVRECDRVGMAKKEAPYRLRKYHAMIEEVLHDPISVSQLKIDGKYLIKELHMKPGPRMGWILYTLLEEVLEDPKQNTVEILTEKVKELDKLSNKELKELGEKAKQQKETLEEEEIAKLHDKHGVKR